MERRFINPSFSAQMQKPRPDEFLGRSDPLWKTLGRVPKNGRLMTDVEKRMSRWDRGAVRRGERTTKTPLAEASGVRVILVIKLPCTVYRRRRCLRPTGLPDLTTNKNLRESGSLRDSSFLYVVPVAVNLLIPC